LAGIVRHVPHSYSHASAAIMQMPSEGAAIGSFVVPLFQISNPRRHILFDCSWTTEGLGRVVLYQLNGRRIRDMNATQSGFELDALSRNQSHADTEIPKDDAIEQQSIRCQPHEPLVGRDSNHASHPPIGPGVQTASRRNRSRRSRKWRSILNHCEACCLVSGVVVALILVPIVVLPFSYSNPEFPSFGFCGPDGAFNTGLDAVSICERSHDFRMVAIFDRGWPCHTLRTQRD
jgi:hypothetical protein